MVLLRREVTSCRDGIGIRPVRRFSWRSGVILGTWIVPWFEAGMLPELWDS